MLLSDEEVKDLLIRLARLSQKMTITSSCGKLKTNPEEPNDPDYKAAELILRALLESGKLREVIVKPTEVRLSFTDDIYEQFNKVAKREPNFELRPGAMTINTKKTWWIKFKPQESRWVQNKNP